MLSTLAPAADEASAVKPAITMSLWCTCYSITIIIFRVIGRYLRTRAVFIEDVIMALSIFILIARVVLVIRILSYGTNNVVLSSLVEMGMERREVGSQLVLVTRMLYALYLWVVKLAVGIFLTRVIDQYWASKALLSKSSGGRIIKTFLSRYTNCMFYGSLILSFIAILVSELAECRPFNHYWQVTPDPGPSCRHSYGQLFTMGGFNILTDMVLIALPLPLIIEAKLPKKVKLESFGLMLFPLINIIFTAYRLPNIVSDDHLGSQRYRTLMASLDILISTASANALVVTSFLQGRGFKRTRNYKNPRLDNEQSEEEDRASIVTQQPRQIEEGIELKSFGPVAGLRLSTRSVGDHRRSELIRKQWGSDEDLVRDVAHVGESPPPVSRRFSAMAVVSSSEGEGVVAADDCSERSTSRLTPYSKTETTIIVTDKKTTTPPPPMSLRVDDGVGDEGRAVTGVNNGRLDRARSPSAMDMGGILVETTWQVDVTAPSESVAGIGLAKTR